MTTLNLTENPGRDIVFKTLSYFTHPLEILRNYDRADLVPDAMAGLTVAVVLLPQSFIYAIIAGMPPITGIYTAIIGAIVGALWGSSRYAQSGPTNTHSLLTFAVAATLALPGSPEYLTVVGLLALMVGTFKLLVGLTRLGLLAVFVSDAVVVGFTAGAGILIAINQVPILLGLHFKRGANLIATLITIGKHLPETHIPSLILGGTVIILILIMGRIKRHLPAAFIVMVLATVVVGIFHLDRIGLAIIGDLPRGLPPLADIPFTDWHLIGKLMMGAVAVGAIGLVQTTSMTRALAAQTGQRVDSNQEFVAQGLANITSGLFSGFLVTTSFNRSALNLQAGARTQIAALFSGIFVLIAMLILAPYAAWLPRTALAGLLMVISYRMIDKVEIKRLLRGGRGDAWIMMITFIGALLLPLEFAVLAGIALSLARYILRTSTPHVMSVLPDEKYRHFVEANECSACPQLGVLEIRGDLYFGAASHVEEEILANMQRHPDQYYLLLRMQNVQLIDIGGIRMLESVVRKYRALGGDVFFVKVRGQVLERMQTLGFEHGVGEDHFLEEDEAISTIFYHVMDPAVCIYECEVRAFAECQNLPRPDDHLALPTPTGMESETFAMVSPSQLTAELHSPSPPMIIDVREPYEFRHGHIPQAQNMPLPRVLRGQAPLPPDSEIVLVCRTARRSRRAAAALKQQGYQHVHILDGGMTRWEAEQYLQAIDDFDHHGFQPPQGKEES